MEKIRSLSRTIVSLAWNMKTLCPMLSNARTDTGVVRKVVREMPLEGVLAPGWATTSCKFMASSSSTISDHKGRPPAESPMGIMGAREAEEAAWAKAIAGRGGLVVCAGIGDELDAQP